MSADPLNAIFQATTDILDNNSGPSFATSPPFISPSLVLFPQPSLLPEVVSKLLDPITYPLPFTNEWGHPSGVMKSGSQAQEWYDGSQLMEKEECRYVSEGRIDQGCSIALQELGQAGSDADYSRTGLLGGFGLDIIRFGGESWARFGS